MPKGGKTRRWTPQGAGDFEPYELSPENRVYVVDVLKAHDIRLDDPSEFLEALALAISMYRSDQRLAQSCKPAQVRKNLEAASRAAEKLFAQLEALDGNSFSLLTEVMAVSAYAEPNMSALIGHAGRIRTTLQGALDLAKEYPERGRLPDTGRLWLAYGVATLISEHLGQNPTTTKNGLYVSLLELTLDIATGHEPSAVHELAGEAAALFRCQKSDAGNPN